jgi:predicted nucleic acid-binding protein
LHAQASSIGEITLKRRAAKPAKVKAEAAGLVLDAGALQALEGRNVRLLFDLKRASELGLPIRIPAGSLAQSWRGGPRSATIARLLKQRCTVVQVDERSAKQIGEFVAHLRLPGGEKPDVVDAHVALVTKATRSLVWTTDPSDMAHYQVDADFVRRV